MLTQVGDTVAHGPQCRGLSSPVGTLLPKSTASHQYLLSDRCMGLHYLGGLGSFFGHCAPPRMLSGVAILHSPVHTASLLIFQNILNNPQCWPSLPAPCSFWHDLQPALVCTPRTLMFLMSLNFYKIDTNTYCAQALVMSLACKQLLNCLPKE